MRVSKNSYVVIVLTQTCFYGETATKLALLVSLDLTQRLVRRPAPSYSMAIIAVLRAHARRHCAIKKQLAEQHLLESARTYPLGLEKFVEKVTEAWRPREERIFT